MAGMVGKTVPEASGEHHEQPWRRARRTRLCYLVRQVLIKPAVTPIPVNNSGCRSDLYRFRMGPDCLNCDKATPLEPRLSTRSRH